MGRDLFFMGVDRIEEDKWKIDFWTIFLSILSLIFANLAIFVPQQRTIMLGFLLISIIFAIVVFYFQKINSNEKFIKELRNETSKLSKEIIERFNYIKELSNLKVEVEMLKKRGKKAQINIIDILKVLIAIILIYVIIETLKSL